jgi:Ku protein
VAPRAYWKGYLKLSLVSCPVALFPASSEREKISFNQINKKTGNRIRYRKVDAETEDQVDSSDIIKGYEVGKGQYIEIEPDELEAIAIESKRTIEIDEFVPKKEIDELYLNSPYYLAPDGDVGQQAFAVIREAIRKEGMNSNRAARAFLGLRCGIRMRSAKRMNISRRFRMKKFQRTCWNLPHTSSKRSRGISTLRNLRISTKMR